MKINAIDMLLNNKNLKFKGDEAESASSAIALREAPESEDSMSALNAQSMNNIAFQGVNMAGLKKMGLSSMVALTLLGGSAGLTSCTEEPDYPKGTTIIYDNTKIVVDIDVNIYMTDEELVKAVLEEIRALREEQKEQTEINKAILAELINQGISLERIMTLLEKMNMTAADIFNLLKENTDKQDQILDEITKGNEDLKAQLTQILNAINKGNKLSAENNKLLTMILVQMGQANKNDQTMITLLNAILKKVNESIQNDKAIAAKQQLLLQAILGKLSEIDDHLKQGILAILGKIDSVSDKNIELLTKIFNSIEAGNKNDEKTNELLTAIFNKVQESINQNHEMTEKTHELLWMIMDRISHLNDDMKQGILALLGKIDSVSEKNLTLLTKILNSINESNKNDQKTNELLTAIFNKVQESIDQNHEMTEKTHELLWMIMDKIDNLNSDMKAGILAVLKHVDNASQANINLLIKLINRVDQMDSGDKESTKVLLDILAKIEASIESNKEMDAKTQALLQSILENIQNFNGDLKTAVDKILAKMDQISAENKILLGDILNNVQNFNADMKTGFAAVIENMDKMSAENRAFFNKVLAKLDNMDDNAKAGLAMLIKQMAENNTLTEMQLNKLKQIMDKLDRAHEDDLKFHNQSIALLSELLSKIDKLGSKADAILDAIGNISLDVNVDLSTIEKMLADILAQSKANGDVLTSIESKLNLVAITLEGIKTQIEVQGGDNKAILAKLDQILAKIPDKCNCDVKLQVIIEKLDNIIEEIKKGNKHEGILDDLEDMFN